MDQDNKLDFATVCQYIGQFFLETRNEINFLASELKKIQAERDQALSLIGKKKQETVERGQ